MTRVVVIDRGAYYPAMFEGMRVRFIITGYEPIYQT
jgi:hypothetical protein